MQFGTNWNRPTNYTRYAHAISELVQFITEFHSSTIMSLFLYYGSAIWGFTEKLKEYPSKWFSMQLWRNWTHAHAFNQLIQFVRKLHRKTSFYRNTILNTSSRVGKKCNPMRVNNCKQLDRRNLLKPMQLWKNWTRSSNYISYAHAFSQLVQFVRKCVRKFVHKSSNNYSRKVPVITQKKIQ